MKKIDFDNYKFGVKTQVKFEGDWRNVKGVDFTDRTVMIAGDWIYCEEIEKIREFDL